jgi:hypothetical protein
MHTSPDGPALETAPVAVEVLPKRVWHRLAFIWLSKNFAPYHSPDKLSPRRARLGLITICAAIFVVALGVRLLHWQDTRVETLQEDSLVTTLVNLYENDAQRMEEDGGLIFPARTIDPGDARMLVHPPGFAILVNLFYGTTPSTNHYFALRLTLVLSDALAAVLLFLVTLELFPRGLAIIAAMIFALSPHFAYYALWLSPDSLVVPPILLGAWFFIKASKRPHLATMIASGAFFGLACWLRSNPLLLAPLFAVIVFFTFAKGARLRSASALVMATAFVIAPITLRNWMVYHRFIPLTIVTGLNLIQGLAEFDREDRFGLPPMDADACAKDVEWHGRPEYAENLFVPDGIERDRYRFERGLEVIRSNPGWFAKVMALRMAFMLRYNDFRPQNNRTFTSIAPTILPDAGFSHAIDIPADAQPVWSTTPSDLAINFETLSPQARLGLDNPEYLSLQSSDPGDADQFASPAVPVKEKTDYILTVPVRLTGGRATLHVRALDSRFTLQSKNIFNPPKKDRSKKRRAKERPLTDEASAETEPPITLVQIPFSTASNKEVRLILSSNSPVEGLTLQMGPVQLFEVGATANQWTTVPRSIFRALQKNIFKTDVFRGLIFVGLVLLAFARRRNALLMLLAVPVYYLLTHAAFSTEHRYILALHAFLFVIAALPIYASALALKMGVIKLIGNSHWLMRPGQENQTPTVSLLRRHCRKTLPQR